MTELLYLIPISIVLGLIGLGAFLWAHRGGQFEDLEGAAERVLLDREDRPLDHNGCVRSPTHKKK
jgi:cbb3-type cytochrome oxidase maturation protein